MVFGASIRLLSRSTSVHKAAGGLSSCAKVSPFRFSAPKPLSHRIFRCPIELSVCLETVQPVHTVTAKAVMASTFIFSCRSYSWIPEGPVSGIMSLGSHWKQTLYSYGVEVHENIIL